jgi:hypothetical protein
MLKMRALFQCKKYKRSKQIVEEAGKLVVCTLQPTWCGGTDIKLSAK